MRQPGIDGQRLAGAGWVCSTGVGAGGDRQESRRHRKPKEREGENGGAEGRRQTVDGIEGGRCRSGVAVWWECERVVVVETEGG